MENSFSHSNQSAKRRVGFAFLLAAFLGSCATTELRAQVVVVPNSLATSDGNSSGTTPTGAAVVRHMQIHDASQFGALSGPSLLTQFAWRPDMTLGQSGPRTVTVRIYASTTRRSVAGLSLTFADNLGANNTLVFDGTLTWTTENSPGPGNTRQFDIVFPLTTPFLYDPAAGNLLLDIQQSADGSSITFDRVANDPTTKGAVNTSSPTAPTAQFFLSNDPVTQFTFRPPLAQVVVVPNAQATNDGNGTSTSTTGPASVRWLQIHDASQFGALSGPSFLTKFAYRPDTILGQSGPRSWILRIYASTTSRSVAGISTTFAGNHGTNNTLVFDGTVTVTTGNLPGPGNTRQFDYVFPFTTPFLYDPAAGNLVLDLQIVGNGSALTFDTVLSGDPAIGRVFANSSSTATTGTIWADTHVTQFTFEPPPLVTIRASQVEVCWNSISNLTYQVQYRSDLTPNVWTSLMDCVRSTGSTSCIFDPVVVGQPQRFYRVVMTNCVPGL